QKTVGLRATRSKAFVSRSKLLGFQCCEARAGQAPPLKVASVPVRKRCLIAFVQYASSQAKSTRPCVKALVAAVDYDVRATGRVVCSHIGFLFGHPDRFPFPAECLTISLDASTQAQLPGALHPDHQVPDLPELSPRRRDPLHDNRPARRNLLPLTKLVAIPVISLKPRGAIGEQGVENF